MCLFCPSLQQSRGQTICIFLLSTYTDGQPPDSAAWFSRWVADTASDFRVDKSLLNSVHFAVFALGNSLYTQHYNTAGRELYKNLQHLSAHPVVPLGLGDQNVAQSKYGGKIHAKLICNVHVYIGCLCTCTCTYISHVHLYILLCSAFLYIRM